MSNNSFDCLKTLDVGGVKFDYFSLPVAAKKLGDIAKLPFTLKVLLENLLRYEDGKTVTAEDIKAIANWLKMRQSEQEIMYRPARVLMQDFTGVPAVVDLAAMRDALRDLGGDPRKINPLSSVDLVIDHSVQVDEYATATAFVDNTEIEMQRNHERYQFLRWGQKAFDDFRVVPPGTGICHQVNLEYLGKGVWYKKEQGRNIAYPDTLVGTDSHTTMINGLGVLGWGVGGIEAEAAMLGQPISMLIPEVIGFKITGEFKEGVTATDLVLTVVKMLREKGVVGKFVEFYGAGLQHLPLPDRATVANMAPEYGATCGFFPIDQVTLDYLKLTGRDQQTIALVEAYAKAQGMWHEKGNAEPIFTDTLALDLADVRPTLAGPKRPQDKVLLEELPEAFAHALQLMKKNATDERIATTAGYDLQHGDVVIAAITSCTNTSNPSVMMAAGLLAKKAVEKGLSCKPWVKTSLAPGSKVVTEYLAKAGLQASLDQLGFNLVGYGCTTCIGNSGPLPLPVVNAINEADLVVSAVLSGNRNFEGRIHPFVKANWLASPPLVVAYALVGNTRVDLTKAPVGHDKTGKPVFLKDIWPSNQEIAAAVAKVDGEMFRKQYADVFTGNDAWRNIAITESETYDWNSNSTYIQKPPFFNGLKKEVKVLKEIKGAHVLALLGDSITTDHISPAGSIKADSPAGRYLQAHGVVVKDFNSYGARRGNHEVMMRGTFANVRIRNEMVPGVEGGFTKFIPTGEVMPIYDAAMKYQAQGSPLVVIAGKEYGTGSSRDWAAKGALLLGVKAVIAESFERIHRSNLIGMGILPLQFPKGVTRKTLKLDGHSTYDILNLDRIQPGDEVTVIIHRNQGGEETLKVKCRIDTHNEIAYYQNGGILQYVLRNMA